MVDARAQLVDSRVEDRETTRRRPSPLSQPLINLDSPSLSTSSLTFDGRAQGIYTPCIYTTYIHHAQNEYTPLHTAGHLDSG